MNPNASALLPGFFRLLILVAAGTGGAGRAEEGPDEFTREVAAYELTLPQLEAYGQAMTGLADWAEAHPARAAAMTKRTPKGPATFKATLAHAAAEPAIAEQLKKFQLSARDFVLIPTVLLQAQIAALGEAQGRTFPADRINPKNVALVRANEKRIGEILTRLNTDRSRLARR